MKPRSRLLRLLWVDATSGVPLIFGFLGAAVTVVLLLAITTDRLSPGIGDPLNLLLTVSMYTTALALAGGAAHAGSTARKGLRSLGATTPAGSWAPVRLTACVSVAWAMFAQLLGLALVLVRADSGESSLWVLLLGLQSLVLPPAAALVGAVIGARWTAAPVAAGLAILCFAWFYGFSYAPGRWRLLSPVYPEIFCSQPVIEPNHMALYGQTGLALSLGCAAVAIMTLRHRVALGMAALAGTVVSVVVLVGAPAALTQYRVEDSPSCGARDGVTLCVFPQYRDRLSVDLASIVELRRAVSPFVPTPTAFRQEGLPPAVAGIDYLGVYATDADDLRRRGLEAVLPPPGCPSSEVGAAAAVELTYWALSRTGHPDPYAELPDVTTWTTTQTQDWVDPRLDLLQHPC